MSFDPFSYIYTFLDLLFSALQLAIVGRALLSWFPLGPGNPFYPLAVILHQVTEPILGPLRRIIPTIGMIDISPIVALLLINFIHSALLPLVFRASRGF